MTSNLRAMASNLSPIQDDYDEAQLLSQLFSVHFAQLPFEHPQDTIEAIDVDSTAQIQRTVLRGKGGALVGSVCGASICQCSKPCLLHEPRNLSIAREEEECPRASL